jgi:2-iminobutanoate/2-iminopropanoate deaminase
MIERISPPGVPAPRGPYSPAVRAGDFVYVAGQVPVDPVTNQAVLGDIRQETRQVLNNVRRILEGSGCGLADVVRTTVYLADVKDFAAMNEVYAEYFGEAKPARTTIAVAALPLPNAKVEIDAIAYLKACVGRASRPAQRAKRAFRRVGRPGGLPH